VSRSLKAHILLVLITLIWGSNFVVIKNALADVSPLFFNAVRMSLAAVVLAAIFYRELPRLTAGALRAGCLVGLFLFLGSELQTMGLKYTTPSKSAFLTGVSVVLVPVLLAVFWKRGINRWTSVGVVLAFVGLYLLTVPASAGAGLNLRSMNRGDLLTLGAAVVFAFHIIFVEHAIHAHSTQSQRWQQVTVIQVAVTALLMVITTSFAETVYVTWSPRVLWGIGITGFLSLALAFAIQAWAQQFTPATHTALIFSLEPVFAWLTSFIFLGERLGGRSGLGAACILAGLLISEEKAGAESMGVSPDHAAVPAQHG
jgi:drug/metabolite transporter (DMT)-like permease